MIPLGAPMHEKKIGRSISPSSTCLTGGDRNHYKTGCSPGHSFSNHLSPSAFFSIPLLSLFLFLFPSSLSSCLVYEQQRYLHRASPARSYDFFCKWFRLSMEATSGVTACLGEMNVVVRPARGVAVNELAKRCGMHKWVWAVCGCAER